LTTFSTDGIVLMREVISGMIKHALESAFTKGMLERLELPFVEVEATREAAHGDYASNAALVLASKLKKNPRQIAGIIASELKGRDDIIDRIEIAGPGFINLFISDDYWRSALTAIDAAGENYGTSNIGLGKRVMVEFISANPTGPLHIGHARGAIVGDVIANLLERSGFSVQREYYINDAGNQMNNLGKSVYLRCKEIQGQKIDMPETAYRGDYIIDIARAILNSEGENCLAVPAEEISRRFTDYAAGIIMAGIKEDIELAGVRFDRYYSERELYRSNAVSAVLDKLEAAGHIYSDG